MDAYQPAPARPRRNRAIFLLWPNSICYAVPNSPFDAMNHAGVRYPPQLLDDVVAVLASAQAAIPQLTASGPSADQAGSLGGGQLGSLALHASAMGAAMAVRMEPVTPVDPKSVARAFRYGSCFSSGTPQMS